MKSKIIIILFGIIMFITVVIGVMYINTLKNDIYNIESVYNHNINTINDSLLNYKLKDDSNIAYINSLLLTNKQLDKNIIISKTKIKEIEKILESKIQYISKLENNIIIDTIIARDSIIKIDSITYENHWSCKNKFYNIDGKTNFKQGNFNTIINNINIPIDLVVGVDENWKIFVNSNNPYFNVSTIKGAYIMDDKKFNRIKRNSIEFNTCLSFDKNISIPLSIMYKYDLNWVNFGVGISYEPIFNNVSGVIDFTIPIFRW